MSFCNKYNGQNISVTPSNFHINNNKVKTTLSDHKSFLHWEILLNMYMFVAFSKILHLVSLIDAVIPGSNFPSQIPFWISEYILQQGPSDDAEINFPFFTKFKRNLHNKNHCFTKWTGFKTYPKQLSRNGAYLMILWV